MWRHAVRSEHLRLYFAAVHVGATPSEAAALRAALGTEGAAAAATALQEALEAGARERVEALVAATTRGAEYDENTAQQIVRAVSSWF